MAAQDADRVAVDLDLPLGEGGRLQVEISAPLPVATTDRAFLLDLIGRVAGFARDLSPGGDLRDLDDLRDQLGEQPDP